MTNFNIFRRAQDPKAGMTIAELYDFVQLADACNIDPRTPVKITAGWRQQIRAITTKEGK